MKIGEIVLNNIRNKKDFIRFMDELNLEGETFIIKPNWVDCRKGSFTEARILELIFDYLKGKKLFIIESYTSWRNEPYFNGEEVDHSDLAEGKLKWTWFKEQDNWFLNNTNIKNLLEKYGVEYINITNEVWKGEVADNNLIKKLAEKKFRPLAFKEFYSYVPKKLFELKDATLISLSKIKTERLPFGVSASTKNIFGLIPDPCRHKYHGKNHKLISQSILDINKIYRTLFKTVFVVEGIYTSMIDYMTSNKLVENLGIIFGGKNSVEVDSILLNMNNLDYRDVDYLLLAEKEFGGFNRDIFRYIPTKFLKSLK